MSPLLSRFLDPSFVSLKICGVTSASDAEELVKRNVDAVGLNFWPNSKRYLPPDQADFLTSLSGRILRVGVFVNAEPAFAISLVERGWIDVIQLHGDEGPEETAIYQKPGLPFFKAIGVKSHTDLAHATDFGACALLLDAAAPGVYGGTGEVFDWNVARTHREAHPETPIILAGGIVPGNATAAAMAVRPCALDVASGAEIRPGVKDFTKVDALLEAIRQAAQG
jgi:phosphoribosylanthranilate isomerase